LAKGRVLQFDQARGYGFVAADDGGEDIFLHESVFDGDSDGLVPGIRVEFKVMAGDRGRKAFAAHLIADEPEAEPTPSARPVPSSVPVPVLPAPAPSALAAEQAPDEEQICDVLSQTEFVQELTELLLDSAPALTGQQILDVRQGVLQFARKHGWVDI
jgi:cold shock protein